MKKLITGLVVLAGLCAPTAGLVAFQAAPAQAASCYAGSCDFTDPYTTGCSASDYVALAERPAWGGAAQLWWSNTCQTNWVRYDAPGGSWTYYVGVENSFGQWDWYGASFNGWMWGDQLYSPGAATMCIQRIPNSGGQAQTNCWTQ